MDALISKFVWWLVTFLAIYAVIFLALRTFLRRYVFPQRAKKASSSDETPGADH